MLDRQRGEKQHWEQRGEGRGKGDAPGMRAGISMEHMERTMMEDVFHCSLLEHILIHIAACGRFHIGASGCFLKDLWPIEKKL